MDLQSFLPGAVLQYLSAHPSRPLLRPERMEGACMFADVSGFTALSESLAALGGEGAEVLTRVLNEFYAAVIAVLEPAGGDVMRFAGDAVTVFFPGEGALGRAHRAGLDLQTMMGRFAEVPTPAGPAALRMKIGIASGECRLFLVGDGERLDYVFAGAPVDGAAEAEHHAGAGEVVFAGGEFQVPGSKFQVEAIDSGFWRVLDVPEKSVTRHSTLDARPLELETRNSKLETVPESAFLPFLHPKLVELAAAGGLERINEHRPVTVLFIRFGEQLDPAVPEDLAVFGRFYSDSLAAARRFDGTINKVDCGDKGNTLLVLFGAPVAHEDDAERALEFALDLQRSARESGLSLRVGINRARVFCGLVGSPRRREYTVMGDGVNLAARLMQAAAEGSVLAGEGVKEGRAQAYRFQDLPPMRFKGKSRALPVARLQGRSGDRMDIPFFVGRQTELGRLAAALETRPSDRPFLAWIWGEAGVGKSFLLHYFGELHLGDSRHYSRCHSYTAGIAHYAVQKLVLEALQDLLVGGAFPSRDKALALLSDKAPDIAEYAPLLLRTLNLAAPGEVEPELEPEVRRSLLWRMMLLVLTEAARQGEMSWIVDNGEWLDPESRDFLLHAARVMETGRFRVLVASREAEPEEPGLSVTALELAPLSQAETAELSRRLLEVEVVPEEAVRKVWEVSKGNPLMSQETLRLMFTSGYLARSEDAPDILLVDETREPEMPGSVAGFVLAQADALPAADRGALARLCVVGENISRGLLPHLGLDPAVAERLAADGRYLRFNPLSQNYYFVKPSFQQALYESLEFTFRRETHREAAEGLEVLVHPSRPDRGHLLAWHYGEARDPRALPHLHAIARAARDGYALKEAAAAYGRIVDIGGEAGDDIQEAVLALTDLLLLLGKAAEADQLLNRRWERFDDTHRSAAHLARAAALRGLGAFPQAEEQARRALDAARTPRSRFLAESFHGKLLGQTGRVREALQMMEGLVREHKRFKDDPEYQMNRMRLAFIKFQTGQSKEAIKTFAALTRWFKVRKQIKGLYTIQNNLSMMLLESGSYKKALQLSRSSYEILKRYGIWEAESILSITMNLGLLALNLGHFEFSAQYLQVALAYAKRFRSPLVYRVHYLYALLMLHQGRFSQALLMIDESYRACEGFHVPKNETHEIAMEIYLELCDHVRFDTVLRAYETEITQMRLSYLLPSLQCYAAEGCLLRGDSAARVNEMAAYLDQWCEERLHLEAFRAARFLYGATREERYIDRMGQLLGCIEKQLFHVEYALAAFARDPSPRLRRRLLAILTRYPYGPLLIRAQRVFLQSARSPRQRAGHQARIMELRQMLYQGLPPDLIPGE